MNLQDININNYIITTPYPKILNKEPQNMIKKYLINIYAGKKGVFTSLSQYIYQYFILKPSETFKNISEALEKISITEMIHSEIVSQILLSIGVSPKFCTYIDNNPNICNYWSASNIIYETDLKQFITYNITLEECAIKEYTLIKELTTSENIKEIIDRILEDENSHLNFFNDVLKNL